MGAAGERRAETDSLGTDSSGLNSTLLHPALNKVGLAGVLSVEAEESSISSDVLNNS